jgi:HSP20 family protein
MVRYQTNRLNRVGQLRDEVDRLFGDLFGSTVVGRSVVPSRAFPALNVWERGDELFVEAEVPGLKGEDIDISVVGNELVLKGKRGAPDHEEASYHRRERGVGEFNRLVRLPFPVDADKIQAKLTDGVLLIMLPKAETAKPRKIQVANS